MKVVQFTQTKSVPKDSADNLRRLADQVESGECTGVVWCATVNDEFEFGSGSSMNKSLILSSLLQDWAVRRFRE